MAETSTRLSQLPSNGKPVPKVPTGINGVDEVLFGGLPQGETSLVGGGPGTGKTLFGLEYLYRGALANEPGIFVTFEETADAIRRNAGSMGWDLKPLEDAGQLLVMQAELPFEVVLSGEFDIEGLLAILAGQAQKLGARRIVIDAIDVLLRIFQDPLRQQNQLYALNRWLHRQNLTALLTVKQPDEKSNFSSMLDYMVNCAIRLDHRVLGQVATRRLQVIKYRGSGFLSNEYPYVISHGGITLMPISKTDLHQNALGSLVPTGSSQLDALLGGGFLRHSLVMIGGSSGTGKTTLACSFSAAACERGERVLYMSFEEAQDPLVSFMGRTGVDLRPALDGERLKILTAMPESMGVEEHLLRLFRAIEDFEPDHLVVDAISACQRFGSEQSAFDFLVRLSYFCRERGITCIFTNQTSPAMGIEHTTGIGISSLMDALVLLEQDWPKGRHERRLLIVKSRGMKHSHAYHPFEITDNGFSIKGHPIGHKEETSTQKETST